MGIDGFEGRLVVGVAWDGARFVWHEWVELAAGGWVAVDPSFAQLPTTGSATYNGSFSVTQSPVGAFGGTVNVGWNFASQSGNFVSSFLNYARQTGVGISRAVSAGNAAAVTPADYLDWYADDPATAVSLAYVEGIVDGRALLDRFASVAARKPLVVVKGGATENGARAAASHTGALAAEHQAEQLAALGEEQQQPA